MTDPLQEIKAARRKIDTAKSRRAELTGQQRQLLEQLKDEFGCESLEDAERLAKAKKEQLDEAESDLQYLVEDLAEEMEAFDE